MALNEYSRTGMGGEKGGRTFARFFTEEVVDPVASAAAGRPIYRSEERVELINPGDLLNKPVLRVSQLTDEQREQFKTVYAQFKKGEEQSHEGTPIDQWPVLNRAQIRELKAKEIYTVEQCAGLSDLGIQQIGMGGRAIRDLARAYLDEAQRMALLTKTTHMNEMYEAKVAAQDRQIEELKLIVEQLHRQSQVQMAMPNAVSGYTPMPTPEDMQKQAMASFAANGGGSSLDSLEAPVKRRGRPPNVAREPAQMEG